MSGRKLTTILMDIVQHIETDKTVLILLSSDHCSRDLLVKQAPLDEAVRPPSLLCSTNKSIKKNHKSQRKNFIQQKQRTHNPFGCISTNYPQVVALDIDLRLFWCIYINTSAMLVSMS